MKNSINDVCNITIVSSSQIRTGMLFTVMWLSKLYNTHCYVTLYNFFVVTRFVLHILFMLSVIFNYLYFERNATTQVITVLRLFLLRVICDDFGTQCLHQYKAVWIILVRSKFTTLYQIFWEHARIAINTLFSLTVRWFLFIFRNILLPKRKHSPKRCPRMFGARWIFGCKIFAVWKLFMVSRPLCFILFWTN